MSTPSDGGNKVQESDDGNLYDLLRTLKGQIDTSNWIEHATPTGLNIFTLHEDDANIHSSLSKLIQEIDESEVVMVPDKISTRPDYISTTQTGELTDLTSSTHHIKSPTTTIKADLHVRCMKTSHTNTDDCFDVPASLQQKMYAVLSALERGE